MNKKISKNVIFGCLYAPFVIALLVNDRYLLGQLYDFLENNLIAKVLFYTIIAFIWIGNWIRNNRINAKNKAKLENEKKSLK